MPSTSEALREARQELVERDTDLRGLELVDTEDGASQLDAVPDLKPKKKRIRVKPDPHRPLSRRQKLFLKVFEKNAGYIKKACKIMGVARSTYYKWMDESYIFKNAIHEISEGLIDDTEMALKKAINEGNITAIIFHLKTKGRERGYIERTEIDHRGAVEVAQSPEVQTLMDRVEQAMLAERAPMRVINPSPDGDR